MLLQSGILTPCTCIPGSTLSAPSANTSKVTMSAEIGNQVFRYSSRREKEHPGGLVRAQQHRAVNVLVSEPCQVHPRLCELVWVYEGHISPLLCRRSARESGNSCVSSSCVYRSSVWVTPCYLWHSARSWLQVQDLFAVPKHTQHDHASGRLHLLSFFQEYSSLKECLLCVSAHMPP